MERLAADRPPRSSHQRVAVEGSSLRGQPDADRSAVDIGLRPVSHRRPGDRGRRPGLQPAEPAAGFVIAASDTGEEVLTVTVPHPTPWTDGTETAPAQGRREPSTGIAAAPSVVLVLRHAAQVSQLTGPTLPSVLLHLTAA